MNAKRLLQAFREAIANHHTDDGWQYKKEEAWIKNKWFEPESINQSLDAWNLALSDAHIEKWLAAYRIPEQAGLRKLGIIMAGNIPLVGMHDLICGLVAGCEVRAKVSSDDEVLPKYWWERVLAILPELENRVIFGDQLKGVDMAIATGSNNSARYFEYYFRDIPHILRKNRNSAAVLTGSESEAELVGIGHDVFDYFGLGCRNVTHLLLPENYAFKELFDAWEPVFGHLVNHNKYVNNYHYHKALLLMNLDPHMDTGYLLLKEKDELYSPVGMLNYHFYKNEAEALQWLEERKSDIQCITSAGPVFSNIKPGMAQQTMLWDYADGVDTLDWLVKQ